MAGAVGVSLNPEQFVDGGLLGDVDVTWTEVSFEMWDYGGKVAEAVPALRVKMEDDEEQEHEQYWSMGRAADWQPSEDGKTLVSVGSATAINKNSNGALLLASLVNAGFPVDKIGEDCSVFEGMQCHMTRVPAPKRQGLNSEDQKDRKYEQTILIVSEILSLPGEKGKGKTTKSKGKGKAPAAAKTRGKGKGKGGDDDLTEVAEKALMALLADADDPIDRADLPGQILADPTVAKHPERKELVKLVYSEEFLSNGPWTFEDDQVTL